MPEIKHNFTSGKMNKDVDERLVPNGEYRDAMNIQVTTSDASEVGTVQNILGNKNIQIANLNLASTISKTIGSIADEKNDILYWLVWTENIDYIFSYKRNDTKADIIFRDVNKNVLRFHPDNVVTGINVIDDMLFWTDNHTEPKKINIPRCKAGTVQNSSSHTRLINDSQGFINGISPLTFTPVDIEEKHITVVKKAPSIPLEMKLVTFRDPEKIYTGVITIANDDENSVATQNPTSFTGPQGNIDVNNRRNFNGITTEDGSNTFNIKVLEGVNSLGVVIPLGNINDNATSDPTGPGIDGWHKLGATYPQSGFNNIEIGKTIVFKPFDSDGTPPGLPVTDFVLKGTIGDYWPEGPGPDGILGDDPTTSVDESLDDLPFPNATTGSTGTINVIITSIDGFPPLPDIQAGDEELKYVVDVFDEDEKLFEFKFPRFSYRYKYEDGEYSPFAPFTQVAFSPGSFDYHPRKGYNLGMTNRLKQVELGGFIHDNLPKDIVSIDILFKDEPSPNIYVVDTIRPDDDIPSGGTVNAWQAIKGNATTPPSYYIIKSETVNSVLPSNQLLRPWDNVPRKALAQDITGNRVVYGNYVQNYDLTTANGLKYSVEFKHDWSDFKAPLSEAGKSIKSLREYQLGVVFIDKYGRETPVISNPSGTIKLGKDRADKNNRLKVGMRSQNVPEELTYYKFFVKETADEYYNMAMDRWYDAEDGNIWLAFPSSDRNKIDIDTFLILKKGADDNALVAVEARYKVIAIENNAPDFIKTTKTIASTTTHTSTSPIFDSYDKPFEGSTEFKLNYKPFHGSPGQNLDALEEDLYISFSKAASEEVSDIYRITSLTKDWDQSDDAIGTFDSITGGDASYNVQIDKALQADVNFISNDPSGASSVSIANGAIVNIHKHKVENKPQFDGRFFVKIYYDDVFKTNISKTGDVSIQGKRWVVRGAKKIYGMKPSLFENHTKGDFLVDGATDTDVFGLYSPGITGLQAENTPAGYYVNNKFASFALYFRRFKKMLGDQPSRIMLAHLQPGGTTGGTDVVSYLPDQTGEVNWQPQANWWREFGATEVTTNLGTWHSYQGEVIPLMAFNLTDLARGGYTANWMPRWYVTSGSGSTQWVEGHHETKVKREDQSAENARDTEVWFVDGGPYVASQINTSTHAGDDLAYNLADHTQYGTSVSPYPGMHRTGIQNRGATWDMELGFGGIEIASSHLAPGQDDPGFFNIGDWNSNGKPINEKYNDDIKTWVNKLDIGSQFRWKEDPDQIVYTVGDAAGGEGSGNRFRFSGYDRQDIYSTNFGPTVSDVYNNYGTESMAEQVGFNHTKNWILKKITPQIFGTWNPWVHGSIGGGTTIELEAHALPSGDTCTGVNVSDDLMIFVKDIIDATTNKQLQVGMALSRYSNVSGENYLSQVSHLGTLANQYLVIRDIVKINPNTPTEYFQLLLGGYEFPMKSGFCVGTICASGAHRMAVNPASYAPVAGTDYTFTQVGINGYSPNSEFNINTMGAQDGNNIGKVGAVGYTLQFLENPEGEETLSENPAIWETEPKDIKDLDIYYEATGAIPINFDETNIHEAFPIGSTILGVVPSPGINPFKYTIVGYNGLDVILDDSTGWITLSSPSAGPFYHVVRPDGLELSVAINAKTQFTITIDRFLYNGSHNLPWHNCYSFGNGVESDRIRDNFNLPFIANGVKASTTLDQEYKEEHRKYGLIYSGLYNSTSGVNNLNQFIQAEKITKDINPIYGSIQKLHARDTDLVTLCEDKCLRILSNKDAVYNADGNPQLVATENVLGQTVPFSGEYGISTNPESFASESYRVYFTDKVRGAVLRLSKDGLTPISDYGMSDWFKDNLKLSGKVIGSYDDKLNEYNITLIPKRISYPIRILGSGDVGNGNPQA